MSRWGMQVFLIFNSFSSISLFFKVCSFFENCFLGNANDKICPICWQKNQELQTILFTTDECILESIAKHDTCLIGDLTTLTSSSIDVASEDNDEANRLQNSNNNDAKAASESLTTPFRPSTTERKVHSAHKNFDAPRPSSAREEKDEKGVARGTLE